MLNGLIASLRRFLRPAPLHVCYVLSLDEDTLYADMLHISAMCVWRIYPSARITILTDDQSLPRVQNELRSITLTGAKIRTVGRFEGNLRKEAGSSKPRCATRSKETFCISTPTPSP